jgi:hypothetical protein
MRSVGPCITLPSTTKSFLKYSEGKGFKKEKQNLSAQFFFFPAKKSNRDPWLCHYLFFWVKVFKKNIVFFLYFLKNTVLIYIFFKYFQNNRLTCRFIYPRKHNFLCSVFFKYIGCWLWESHAPVLCRTRTRKEWAEILTLNDKRGS